MATVGVSPGPWTRPVILTAATCAVGWADPVIVGCSAATATFGTGAVGVTVVVGTGVAIPTAPTCGVATVVTVGCNPATATLTGDVAGTASFSTGAYPATPML